MVTQADVIVETPRTSKTCRSFHEHKLMTSRTKDVPLEMNMLLKIHNLQIADPKLWSVRWSHQDGGDQNNQGHGWRVTGGK